MADKVEREYKTTFSEEVLDMDKYNELLRDIAALIVNTDRDNFLLKCELERVKGQLDAAEERADRADKRAAEAEDQLETVVAKRAAEMIWEEDNTDA